MQVNLYLCVKAHEKEEKNRVPVRLPDQYRTGYLGR